ncbi:hypothetical protein L1987_47795 [Smallanthus sonchifolius]|uniref:Uncharacterized protein n=1 Tax=Smallanthus sonchifolius TaxID=185202 RepID=A0ACB9FR26_9ASTR|nr:hypothetical protein L1987_47795 [Smallanthus sonchifolius]
MCFTRGQAATLAQELCLKTEKYSGWSYHQFSSVNLLEYEQIDVYTHISRLFLRHSAYLSSVGFASSLSPHIHTCFTRCAI